MMTGSSSLRSRTPISSGVPSRAGPMSMVRVVVHVDFLCCGADGMPDVGVADAVLAGWLADSHLDTMSSSPCYVNRCCLILSPSAIPRGRQNHRSGTAGTRRDRRVRAHSKPMNGTEAL